LSYTVVAGTVGLALFGST